MAVACRDRDGPKRLRQHGDEGGLQVWHLRLQPFDQRAARGIPGLIAQRLHPRQEMAAPAVQLLRLRRRDRLGVAAHRR